MSTKSKLAVTRFKEGYNCAQAVFSVYAEQFGLELNEAYRLASGFGGGMGRLQETCGAVSAMFMLVGLKFGKIFPTDTYSHELTYSTVRKLNEAFTNIHGTTLCKALLGCNLLSPEGIQMFKAEKLSSKICEKCVETTCLLIEEHNIAQKTKE